MKRWSVLLFGVVNYLLFLGVFLYAIGFVGGFGVPRTLDGTLRTSAATALGVDLALLCLFGLQHSAMARPAFKRRWTRIVPQPIERHVYMLGTCLALGAIFWFWQPMAGYVWSVQHPIGRVILYSLFACGWLTVLITTFLINHFDLFGLRHAWLYFRGRPYTPLGFVTPGPYRLVRHPLYVGWLLAFWSTPTMSVAHFVFAAGMTAYILIAIVYEERDLVQYHGTRYEEYRQRVGMLIPRLPSRGARGNSPTPTT